MKYLNKHAKNVLYENYLSQHAYRSKKLGSLFNLKDQIKLEHINYLTYLVKYSEETRSENYLGQTARTISERVSEHSGRDKKSHLLSCTLKSGYPWVSSNEFEIFRKTF